MSGAAKPLGVLGGTFDPIHYGHLRAAYELAEVLDLGQVCFLPAGDPPHRETPAATAALRARLVAAAIADEPRFAIDERELHRSGPSYTVLTLEELRREHGSRPLVLLLGSDALAGLASWHRWRDVVSLAHVAVALRPGSDLPVDGDVARWLDTARTTVARDLHAAPAGRVYCHAMTPLDISATGLRTLLSAGRDPRYLMPDAVRRMILDTGAYARPRDLKDDKHTAKAEDRP